MSSDPGGGAGDDPVQQAVALHRAGREAEAERLFAKLQKRAPKNPEILFWRGLMAQERDQPKAAIPLFKRALSMLPKQPEIHQQLALAYQQDGQLDAAERHLRKALELRPNDPDSLLHLGNLFAAFVCHLAWDLAVFWLFPSG